MNLFNALITLYLVLGLSASIVLSFEELAEDPSDIRLYRVKRKGGRGGGGRGRGSSGRSSSKSKSKPSDPYPKQPPYNPSYNPSAPYPKQPGQSYPGQTGQSYPGQTGHYPGQTGNYPGQAGYGAQPGVHTGYGTGSNYGKVGGIGGVGTGIGGMGTGIGNSGYGKTKGGLGSLGTGLAGGALGAAVGAYGGYQLGKMVGGLGRHGHYGYYDDRYHYIKCDPPPKIEKDPETNITYIPKTITYDARCEYYDREPPRVHPYYGQRNSYYMNGSNCLSAQNILNTLLIVLSIFIINNGFRFNRFQEKVFSFYYFL